MKIYTYYHEIHKGKASDYQKKMIDLWKLSWIKNGFDPIVLGLADALAHPLFYKFKNEIEKIHLEITGTPISTYGLSCFIRWLAYANQNNEDPFYVSDYDIINKNFKPKNLQKTNDKILFLDTLCPSIAIGKSSQFLSFCNDIIDESRDERILKSFKEEKLRNYHDQDFLFLKFSIKTLDYNLGNYDICTPKEHVSLYFKDDPEIEKYQILHVSHSCCGMQKEKFPDLNEAEIRLLLIEKLLE